MYENKWSDLHTDKGEVLSSRKHLHSMQCGMLQMFIGRLLVTFFCTSLAAFHILNSHSCPSLHSVPFRKCPEAKDIMFE
jgi:hypothetical protein